MKFFGVVFIAVSLGLNGAADAAAQKREKPRAWQDYEIQAAKVAAVTEKLGEHLDGSALRAIEYDQSVPELLMDSYSIPRHVRTDVADALDTWLKDSRQLAQEALNYTFARDRDDKECKAWIAVFESIYEEGDSVSKKLRAKEMKDGDFAGTVVGIQVAFGLEGVMLAGAMKACYMQGAIVTPSLKERRSKLEAESAAQERTSV